MTRPSKGTGTNTIHLLIVLVGFMLLAYYATVSLFSRDALWFLRGFSDHPSRIIVYRAGHQTELRPGQAGFDELATAVQSSLAQGFSRLSSVGFSEQSLQDAYSRHVTLEVFFDRPVRLHAWFRTGRTTQLLFPITGRHSELNLVLLGDAGHYRAGAPALKTLEPIREALETFLQPAPGGEFLPGGLAETAQCWDGPLPQQRALPWAGPPLHRPLSSVT